MSVIGQNDIALQGALVTEEELARLERMLTRFNRKYASPLPVVNQVRQRQFKLPFRITQVTTGPMAHLVTNEGNRLFVGDEVQGHTFGGDSGQSHHCSVVNSNWSWPGDSPACKSASTTFNPVSMSAGKVLGGDRNFGTSAVCQRPKSVTLCEIDHSPTNRRYWLRLSAFVPDAAIVSLLGGVEGVSAGARGDSPCTALTRFRVSDDLLRPGRRRLWPRHDRQNFRLYHCGRRSAGGTGHQRTAYRQPTALALSNRYQPALRAIDGMVTLGVGQRVGISSQAQAVAKPHCSPAIARGTPCGCHCFWS